MRGKSDWKQSLCCETQFNALLTMRRKKWRMAADEYDTPFFGST